MQTQQVIALYLLGKLRDAWNETNLEAAVGCRLLRRQALGLTTVAGALGRAFDLLRHVAADCRRASGVLGPLATLAQELAERLPLAALRVDQRAVGELFLGGTRA